MSKQRKGLFIKYDVFLKLMEKFHKEGNKKSFLNNKELSIFFTGSVNKKVSESDINKDELISIMLSIEKVLEEFELKPTWKSNIFINYVYDFGDGDSIEFDTLLLVKNKDDSKMIINIEVKGWKNDKVDEEKKLYENLGKQIDNKLSESLEKVFGLNKFTKFIGIGLIYDERFPSSKKLYITKTKIRSKEEEIEDISIVELKELLKNSEIMADVKDDVDEAADSTSLANSINRITNNSLKIKARQKVDQESILNSKKNVVLVRGDAGSGKSVLAYNIFFNHNYERVNMLIINAKVVNNYFFGQYKKPNRQITFNAEIFTNNLTKDAVAIVDECQNLTDEQIQKIVQKSNRVLFFGDSNQTYEVSLGTLEERFNRMFPEDYDVIEIKSQYRTGSKDIPKMMNAFASGENKKGKYEIPDDFEMKIFFSPNEFLDLYNEKYQSKNGMVRICTYNCYDSDPNLAEILVGDEKFDVTGYDYDSFCSTLGEKNSFSDRNLIGKTRDVISMDFDYCFIYVPKLEVYERKYFVKVKNSERDIDLKNQIYILLTRAKKGVYWLVDDTEAFIFIKNLRDELWQSRKEEK
ncbi:DNA/RNA helicase domain-containing protein [Mesoplasma whartonense]|uniref:DNA/RNA helicase domain-containing protein n=1 Tax=Mesoplasma whartonense TaxID=2878854 RepID=UPI002022B255|nr:MULTISPECIES: DNA/RNA helicase domain-containing protein [unclassified Mesoplasma]MCL8213046.1 hypothetical protein [Mesoplasma sp. JKS002661]MCL8216307.1 hypothetical protein [Mesoplasma sp. JKS002657]